MSSPERALTEREKPVRYNRGVGTRQADFLFELIDYAGIFPPAALESLVSAENYSNLLDSDNQWIVGNLAWSVERLTDFREFAPKELSWSLAAIGRNSTDWESWKNARAQDGKEIDGFLSHFPDVDIASYEFKVSDLTHIEQAIKACKPMTRTMDVFFELPWDQDISEPLASIASSEAIQVKFRTGGIKPENYPTSLQLATVIKHCTDLELPFKLTAGLHEPIAHVDDSNGANAHGFLNVLYATALAYFDDESIDTMVEVFNSTSESDWAYGDSGLAWKGQLIDTDSLNEVRALFTSLGSCSVTEPLQGLARLASI